MKQELIDQIKKKIEKYKCSVCGGFQWVISTCLYSLDEFDMVKGGHHPVAFVTCKDCKHVIFFDGSG